MLKAAVDTYLAVRRAAGFQLTPVATYCTASPTLPPSVASPL
jgi:hypothetical protein